MGHRQRCIAVIATLGLALSAVACGGDDEESGAGNTAADDNVPDTTGTTAAPAPTTDGADASDPDATNPADVEDDVTEDDGCAAGFTDLQPLGTDIASTARCAAGSPVPQPLNERATVTLSVSSLSSELALPLLLAQANGEFEKENLDVEVEVLSPTDALPLLAQDDVDIMISSASAALFNAVNSGFDVRWSMPVNYSPPSNQDGLWARGGDVELADVADMKIASAVGLGSPVSHNMHTVLMRDTGLSWADLEFEVLPVADIGEALRNGAVDAAVMISPFWIPFVGDPDYTHLIYNTPDGEPLSAVLVAPNLVGERHDVGVAFHRAWIRTINTYLAGPDYKADAEFCNEAAEMLNQDVDSFCSLEGSVYDYEVKAGTTDRMQDTYFQLDVLDYDEPLPEDLLVDRSFVEEAIGHQYDGG